MLSELLKISAMVRTRDSDFQLRMHQTLFVGPAEGGPQTLSWIWEGSMQRGLRRRGRRKGKQIRGRDRRRRAEMEGDGEDEMKRGREPQSYSLCSLV